MIDTIKYRLSDYRSGTDFREHIPCLLENPMKSVKEDETFFSGNLGNLKVKVSKNSLRVENSLCKWYLGDNLQSLTRESIALANEKLSDILHVNMQNADVTRLDIGQNYSTIHKPAVYINSLGELARFRKGVFANEGVNYRTKNIELALYDKLKEHKAKGNKVPADLASQNLLRYELRLMKNIRSTLNRPEFTVKDLSNIDTYNQLQQLYNSMYNKIDKLPEINMGASGVKGVKGFKKMSSAYFINAFGQAELIQQIKTDFQMGRISEKDRRGMLRLIKETSNNQTFFVERECVQELNALIENFSNKENFNGE